MSKLINTVQLQLPLILVLIQALLSKQQPKRPPAYEVFKKAFKQVNLKLTTKMAGPGKVTGIHWFIKHENFKPQNSPSDERLGSFISLAAITEKGVFFKKLNQTWLEIDPTDNDYQEMGSVLETEDSNKITAHAMNDNETFLTVVYQNLTVQTIDLKYASLNPKHKDFQKSFVSKFCAVDPRTDDEAVIRTIALIPYKDWVVFSPSRFSFFKINKKTGQLVSKVRSFVDSVNHIAIPVPSYRPANDPHGQLLRQNPEISDRLKRIFEVPYFIATGRTSSTNALVDWRSMKAISYFSLNKFDVKGFDDMDFRVGSICYYGAVPQSQTYLLSTSVMSKKIDLFSATAGHLLGYFHLEQASRQKQMVWVNQTFYVYILQKEVQMSPVTRFISTFFNMGPFINLFKNFLKEEKPMLQEEFANLNLITFRAFPDEPILAPEKNFGRTDNLFILASSVDDSIVLRPNPLPSDIYCDHPGYSVSYFDHRMLYGGFINCIKICRAEFMSIPKNLNPTTDQVFINCKKPASCPKDQQVHFFHKMMIKGQVYGEEPKSEKERAFLQFFYHCTKYSLTEAERGFASYNGCIPGFNKDPFGICKPCLSRTIMRHKEDVLVDQIIVTPSDCQHFDFLGVYKKDLPMIIYDSYTYKLSNYTFEKLNQTYPYKGFEDPRLNLKKIYQKYFELLSDHPGEFNKFISFHNQFFILEANVSALLPPCYNLINHKADSNFSLTTMNTYALELISKDKSNQAQHQIGVYGKDSPLSTYYCKKNCPYGMFYDFASLSCRRCGFGCAGCLVFDRCEVCEAGLVKYEKPLYGSTHPVEKGLVGNCILGCQEGFYRKGYNGTCLECQKDCLKCMDKVVALRAVNVTHADRNKSFCLKCASLADQTKNLGNRSQQTSLFINISTGECQASCDGFSAEWSSIASIKALYCYRCLNERCATCNINSSMKCLSCKKGFILNDFSECYKFTETIYFIVGSQFIVAFVLILGLVCCYVMVGTCCTKNSKNRKGMTEVERKGFEDDCFELNRAEPRHRATDVGMSEKRLVKRGSVSVIQNSARMGLQSQLQVSNINSRRRFSTSSGK